jgi:hypothetical protein
LTELGNESITVIRGRDLMVRAFLNVLLTFRWPQGIDQQCCDA